MRLLVIKENLKQIINKLTQREEIWMFRFIFIIFYYFHVVMMLANHETTTERYII